MTARGPAHFDGDEIYYDYPPYNSKTNTEEAELLARAAMLNANNSSDQSLLGIVVYLLLILGVCYVANKLYQDFFSGDGDAPLPTAGAGAPKTAIPVASATTTHSNNVNATVTIPAPAEPKYGLFKRILCMLLSIDLNATAHPTPTTTTSNNNVTHGHTTKANTFTTLGGSPIAKGGAGGGLPSMYEELTRGGRYGHGTGNNGTSPEMNLKAMLGGARAPMRPNFNMSVSPDARNQNFNGGGRNNNVGGAAPYNARANIFTDMVSRERGANNMNAQGPTYDRNGNVNSNIGGNYDRRYGNQQPQDHNNRGGWNNNDNDRYNDNNRGGGNNNNNGMDDRRYGTHNQNRNNTISRFDDQPINNNNNARGGGGSPDASFVGNGGGSRYNNNNNGSSRFDDQPVNGTRSGIVRRGQAQERAQSPPDFGRIEQQTRPNNNIGRSNPWDERPINGNNNQNGGDGAVGNKRSDRPQQDRWDDNRDVTRRRQETDAWGNAADNLQEPGRQQQPRTNTDRNYAFDNQRGPQQPQQRSNNAASRQTAAWEDQPVGGGGARQEDKWGDCVVAGPPPRRNNMTDERPPMSQRTGTTRVTNTTTNRSTAARNQQLDDKWGGGCAVPEGPRPRPQQQRSFGTNLPTSGGNNNNREFEDNEQMAELNQMNSQQQQRQQARNGNNIGRNDQDLYDDQPVAPRNPAAKPTVVSKPRVGSNLALRAHIQAQKANLKIDTSGVSPPGRNATGWR